MYPRFGHSCVFHENQLIIFGGATDYDPIDYLTPRDDLLIYDIEANLFVTEKCYQKADLKLRRNHIAEMIGQHMLIYGGIDENKNYLSDMWILEINKFLWLKIEVRANIKTPAVAYHSSVMAYLKEKKENVNFRIFSFNDIENVKNSKKVKYFKLKNIS